MSAFIVLQKILLSHFPGGKGGSDSAAGVPMPGSSRSSLDNVVINPASVQQALMYDVAY
jgi:hypothetical protein